MRPGDLEALYAIQSRPEVARWLYWEPRSLDQVREALREHLERPDAEGVLLGVERRESDGIVGHVNVIVGEHRQGEIGFLINPDHQGRGYATEAARALLAREWAAL